MASPFVFNPPPASEIEMAEPTPERTPYELRRVMLGSSVQARIRRVGKQPPRGEPDNRPIRYFRPCKRATSSRNACYNEVEVYKVVTGTRPVDNKEEGTVTYVTDYVLYWPDTAIVVETGTEYGVRPVQAVFCSWKCLSLFAAKQARDTE
jgi:hypothetical protein